MCDRVGVAIQVNVCVPLVCRGIFRSVVSKKRREFTHARDSPFKIPSKMRACAVSRLYFVTTDLKILVQWVCDRVGIG